MRTTATALGHDPLGEGHPAYAQSLSNLALLYQSSGNFATAEPLCRQAIEIRRAALGEGHPDYAQSLNNLAGLKESMGNFAAAEPLYHQAMRIRRAALGEDHPDYAQSLNNLAALYASMGNFAAAEPLYLEAARSRRVALGEGHPDYAGTLNNLASLYQTIGDYAAAEPLYRQATQIIRASVGEDHPDFATSLQNLAGVNASMGNFEAAAILGTQALEIRRAALGEDHPSYASSLRIRAASYKSMGFYEAAEPVYRQVLEIRRAALGEDHPDFATSLYDMATLYRSMGEYVTAEPMCRQALEIRRAALGEEHPDFATILNTLAVLYVATDRALDAWRMMQQSASIENRLIGQVFSIGSESLRVAFLRSIRSSQELFLSLVWAHLSESPDAVQSVLGLVLGRKAVGAEALATKRDALLSGKYPHLKSLLNEQIALARQIASKTMAGPGPEGALAHRRTLDKWNSRKDRLEAELARQIPEMNLDQKLRASDRRAVGLSLPHGVTLVEFVRFDVYDFHAVPSRDEPQCKPARYLAFVLHGGEPGDVRMIDLGEADPIDRMIADFRVSVMEPPEDRPDRNMTRSRPSPETNTPANSGSLRATVFDKLLPALGDCKRLMLAPDGDLSRLPFEVLPDVAGRLVVDDGFTIDYLNCGRDVLRFGAASTGQPTEALVAADPDYDFDHIQRRAVSAESPVSSPIKVGFWSRLLGKVKTASVPQERPPIAPEPEAKRSGRHSRDLGELNFPAARLPATRVEGEQIAAMLGVRPWLDSAVLEGRLKSECHSPRILHLATHGFFIEDQKRDPNQEASDIAGLGVPGRMTGPVPENPLLRAGLVLAGANIWHSTGEFHEQAEDGLLTAEDVSGLDLLATELVVLSACETGLGQITTGEGVFGLQRAFVLAGAKTLVMSLWAVPDLSTAILMERFYENLLTHRLGRAESLRQAQAYVRTLTIGAIRATWLAPAMIERLAAGDAGSREHLRYLSRQPDDHRPFADPYYWGAFICQGNPGPLESVEPNLP